MPLPELIDLPFGIEEEFALLDPRELVLVDRIEDMMASVPKPDRGEIKPDVHACVVECSTGICHSPEDAFNDLLHLRNIILRTANGLGIALATLGLHPSDDWRTHRINHNPRYQRLLEGGALVPNSVVYGLHVHVEVSIEQERIKAVNDLLPSIPILIALAASSPVRDNLTGLASFRMDTYANCLTVGLPPKLCNFDDVDAYIASHADKGISVEKDLYWDIRPRRQIPTVEIRCMDSQNDMLRALGLALLVRGLVWKSRTGRKRFLDTCSESEIRQNRRRAIADGLSSKLLVNGIEHRANKLVSDLENWFAEVPWANHPALELIFDEGKAIRNEGSSHLGKLTASSGDTSALLKDLTNEFAKQITTLLDSFTT